MQNERDPAAPSVATPPDPRVAYGEGATSSPPPPSAADTQPATLLVIEEQAHVDKVVVETGRVRVRKTVDEAQQVIETLVGHDEVQVDRVPINVYVTEVPGVRHEGLTTIIPVVREVAVTYKALLVVEEIRITKVRVETVDRQTVGVRSERVDVERLPPADDADR